MLILIYEYICILISTVINFITQSILVTIQHGPTTGIY